jgi:maltose alpha-D-glucosyltransferase / alpha-amylase
MNTNGSKRPGILLPDNPYRDYYVWSDTPEKYKDTRIIFTDYETSNWTWDGKAQAYFWHRFFSHQPDLNFENPRVQQEVFKIIDYWCKMGVDGFRLDAVPYLLKPKGQTMKTCRRPMIF